MEKKLLRIEGMSCEHCKKAVETAVLAMPGVTVAQVDLAAKTLQIEYEEHQVALKQIADVIEEEGYHVAADS